MSTDIYAIELDFEKDLLESIIAELKGYNIIVDPTEPLEILKLNTIILKEGLYKTYPDKFLNPPPSSAQQN